MANKNKLLLGTRKGLIVYRQNPSGNWQFDQVHFLGIPISLAVSDERNGTWWAMADHGHWGCKLHRSTDRGKTWEELEAPKYPETEEVKDGVPAALRYLWAFAPSSQQQAQKLYIGTEPGGLFESDNNGQSFTLNRGLWDHPSRKEQWFGGGRDYPGIHSIVVDPRDHRRIYIGISCAGVFLSEDGGNTWLPKNKGLLAEFLPDPQMDVGHDPHLLVMSKNHPDVLWQQNHCGIFRTVDGGEQWTEISENNGVAKFGFAIEAEDNDPNVAWVVPAVSDELRVAVDQALCVCRTDDGGKTWQAYRKGLPQEHCFDIVYRHALSKSKDTLVFGTTTGNAYLSKDRGETWETLNNHLPMVHSVSFVS
ncbi:sialidase family protein [Rapidithrix thailandica]|uniref:Sialidase family protein n=1 Tax=Rapidithrix thailandica TaxID=413964 RepID=A0AAW9RRG0_9BACT